MFLDLLIVVALILTNGVLAMTELAVVSARKGRLQAMADAGSRHAATALALKNDPSKFLSTVQVGITLIGIFSGTYSGVTFAEPLGEYLLTAFPSLGTHADDVAIAVVVTCVTYLSLIIGELVPKQIALHHADRVAVFIATPIRLLSYIARPVVWILDISSRGVLSLLRIKPNTLPSISTDDVRDVIAESTAAGAIDPEERQMLERVMRLGDIAVSAAMTHRRDLVWFDVNEPLDSIVAKVERTQHARYPLCDGSVEKIVGLVTLKGLLLQLARGEVPELRRIAHKPTYLPDSATILTALEEFKQSTSNLFVIVNEHGGMQGIVTLKDVLETIVGTLPEPALRGDEAATEREDGSWLVDGGLSVHEAEEMMNISGLVASGSYHTVAGFALQQFREIPQAGDRFDWNGWRFEVVDMDGTRIDKLLVVRLPAA